MSIRDIKEEFVQNAVITWLSKNNWQILRIATAKEHGVDIKAKHRNYGRYYFIEAKGANNSSSEEVAFIYSLGQIITRMKDGGTTRNYYGLALPKRSANKAIKKLPHQVASKLLLHIFSVDHEGNVRRYMPKDIKEIQTKNA